MDWTIEYIENQRLVKVMTEGAFTENDFGLMIEDIISREYWKPGMFVLFDNRKLDLCTASFDILRKAGEDFIRYNQQLGNGRIAFLVKSHADFGRGRQLQLLTNAKTSAHLAIFMNGAEAQRWLDPSFKRILCVEDNEDDRHLLYFMLKQINNDYNVVILETPSSALNQIIDADFDLFILDYRLNGASGVELCRWIRTRYPNIPIMFYTGMSALEYRRTAIEAGADAYVVKPSGFDDFRGTVEPLLGSPTFY